MKGSGVLLEEGGPLARVNSCCCGGQRMCWDRTGSWLRLDEFLLMSRPHLEAAGSEPLSSGEAVVEKQGIAGAGDRRVALLAILI